MYIGNDLQIAHPSYKIIDDISSGFNGSTTSFALQVSGATPVPFPISTQQVMISVNGVVQEPDPNGNAGFKLLGSNIVFSSAPANGHAFFGVINAGADYVTAGSEFPDGSATAPSFTFQDDQDTGWFRSGSGAVGYSANGVQTLTFDGNGLTVTGDASFVGDSAKNLLWDKSDGQLEFADNAKATFGAGADLSVYHSGSHSFIKDSGTGNLQVWTNQLSLLNSGGAESMIQAIENGAVELYYDNSKKFETITSGARISGDLELLDNTGSTGRLLLGNGGDLRLYHDGSHSYIKDAGTGNLILAGTQVNILNAAANESMIRAAENGAVQLYYDNVKKFETTSSGATVTGGLYCSAGQQIQITGSPGSTGLQLIGQDADYSLIGTMGSHDLMFRTASAERMRLDSSGRLLVGHTASEAMYYTGRIQVQGTNSTTSAITIKTNQADSGGPALVLGKSRGALGSATVVQSGDVLGHIFFNGADGTDTVSYGAEIRCQVDGTPGSNDMPGRLAFFTTADGAATSTERMRINSSGYIGINQSNPASLLHITAGNNRAAIRLENTADNPDNVWELDPSVSGVSNTGFTLRDITNSRNALTIDGSGNSTFAGTVSDSKGNLRSIPQNNQTSSAYTLVAADAGKHVHTDQNITIPASVFSDGDAITIVNIKGSDITLTQGSSLTMYNSSDATTGNRTLASRGLTTILFCSGTAAYISGAGLS